MIVMAPETQLIWLNESNRLFRLNSSFSDGMNPNGVRSYTISAFLFSFICVCVCWSAGERIFAWLT